MKLTLQILLLFSLAISLAYAECQNKQLEYCENCDSSSSQTCAQCQTGFNGNGTATCTPSIAHCNLFTNPNTCYMCKDGWEIKNNACVSQIENCSEPQSQEKCNKCNPYYELSSDKSTCEVKNCYSYPKKENQQEDKTKCNFCQIGYKYDADQNICILDKCEKINTQEDTICDKCEKYYIFDQSSKKCTLDLNYNDDSIRYDVPINGKCKEGYELQNNLCVLLGCQYQSAPNKCESCHGGYTKKENKCIKNENLSTPSDNTTNYSPKCSFYFATIMASILIFFL